MRIIICPPCADGRCDDCTLNGCVCRHGAPAGVSTRLAEMPFPTSAPFELEHALAQARDAGRSEGYRDGYLAGAAEASDELTAALELLDDPAEDLAVLVELDGNGGLVSVLAAGTPEALAVTAAAWTAPTPGSYVEAYTADGDSAPIVLPAPAADA